MNSLSFLKGLIYSLKREYGVPISFYKKVISPSDLTTGQKSVAQLHFAVQRAVIMPTGFQISNLFSPAYMKNVGRGFAYDSFFDKEKKTVLVDAKDLPIEVEPEFNVVIDHRRYAISKINKLDNYAYAIDLTALEGTPTNEVVEVLVQQALRFTQTGVNS